VFPTSLRERVIADHEFLGQSQLDLDPGTTAPAAFVKRMFSFRDQALAAELLRDPEQLLLGAAKLVREPNIFRGLLEGSGAIPRKCMFLPKDGFLGFMPPKLRTKARERLLFLRSAV
jgi:hypothetical protein